ncbi:Troponin C [Operophtera brumata]|uniref:Troponin C n=1 Tax=Operophtera brumata TaxID=104452 RepID=A0A0L7LBZ9_OPEBR|nr:Troponin C [Operophtera brumata]
MEMLRRAFSMFDSEKQGRIEKEKVRTILNTMLTARMYQVGRNSQAFNNVNIFDVNLQSYANLTASFNYEDDEERSEN